MPLSWLKDEGIWEQAKAEARKQHPGLESKDKSHFFAIVTIKYKKMGGKIRK